jgi:hypothetical protein
LRHTGREFYQDGHTFEEKRRGAGEEGRRGGGEEGRRGGE